AELKLLHGSFTASEFLGDLTDAALIHKSANDHVTLIRRKRIYNLEQHCTLLDCCLDSRFFQTIGGGFQSFSEAFPTLCQHVCSDAQQPGSERFALPFKSLNTCQRLVKDFRGYVLCFLAIANTVSNKGIHTLEIALVQFGKAEWIALRRLNQKPFVGFKLQS